MNPIAGHSKYPLDLSRSDNARRVRTEFLEQVGGVICHGAVSFVLGTGPGRGDPGPVLVWITAIT